MAAKKRALPRKKQATATEEPGKEATSEEVNEPVKTVRKRRSSTLNRGDGDYI